MSFKNEKQLYYSIHSAPFLSFVLIYWYKTHALLSDLMPPLNFSILKEDQNNRKHYHYILVLYGLTWIIFQQNLRMSALMFVKTSLSLLLKVNSCLDSRIYIVLCTSSQFSSYFRVKNVLRTLKNDIFQINIFHSTKTSGRPKHSSEKYRVLRLKKRFRYQLPNTIFLLPLWPHRDWYNWLFHCWRS